MAAELDALLRAARRRIVCQTWARQLGEAVRIVLGLAVVLVGADRLWRLPFSPWPLVAVILLLAGGLAGLVAWRRRLGAQATAWVLDERLGLGERLSSAVAMRQSGYQGPLLEPVVGAAEREAAAIDLRVALPEPARGRLRQSVGLGLLLLTVALLPRQTFWRSRTDLATEVVT
ncbi:MAG: hypothetical protein HUU35_01290, partial [Armatimonadetes bacterium]|nr:hypothetical protein [Armatimonadota bacterium]